MGLAGAGAGAAGEGLGCGEDSEDSCLGIRTTDSSSPRHSSSLEGVEDGELLFTKGHFSAEPRPGGLPAQKAWVNLIRVAPRETNPRAPVYNKYGCFQ